MQFDSLSQYKYKPTPKEDVAMDISDIAKVCHEANKAFCQTIGDYSQPKWENAPGWQIESALDGVIKHLENLGLPNSATHESWLKLKKSTGWKYGPTKDAEKKQHPCIVPFDQLPEEEKAKDALFSAIVKALSPLI